MTLKPNEWNALRTELGDAYKADDKRVLRLLELLTDGNYRETSVKASGLGKTTFYAWLKRSPAFRGLVEQAEAEAIVDCIAIVRKAAKPHKVVRTKRVTREDDEGTVTTEETVTSREFDWRAAAWLAERRDPKNWRERKTIDVSQLTNEQIIALLEEDADAGGQEEGDTAEDSGIESIPDSA